MIELSPSLLGESPSEPFEPKQRSKAASAIQHAASKVLALQYVLEVENSELEFWHENQNYIT